MRFLKENGELFESEEALFGSRGHDFIKMIETTSMSKSYKIPVFIAFYNGGKVKMEINHNGVYQSFYEFYHKGSNNVDMLRDKAKYVRLARENTVRDLVKSEGKVITGSEKALMASK